MLNTFVKPKQGHPLAKDLSIASNNNINISDVDMSVGQPLQIKYDAKNDSVNMTGQVLAIDNKPANPDQVVDGKHTGWSASHAISKLLQTNISKLGLGVGNKGVSGKATLKKPEPKVEKTKEEKDKEYEEYERKCKAKMEKYISDETEGKYTRKITDELAITELPFEVMNVPDENGNMVTYWTNADLFQCLLYNDVDLFITYISQDLETSFQKQEIGNNEYGWYLNGLFTTDDLDNSRLNYLDDFVLCRECYGYRTFLSYYKDKLMRFCCDPKCCHMDEVKYENPDDDNVQIIVQELTSKIAPLINIDIELEPVSKDEDDEEETPLTAEEQKKMDYYEKVAKGEVSVNINPYRHTGGYGGYGWMGHYGNTHHNPHYGITYGPQYSTNRTASSYNLGSVGSVSGGITRGHNVGNSQGYTVTNYGGANNISTTSSMSQPISRSCFQFKPIDGDKKVFQYEGHIKENFRIYAEFVSDIIQKCKNSVLKPDFNPNSQTTSVADFWELNVNSLIKRAEDLNLSEQAITANMMLIFDENILSQNQLVTNRKYILPFIQKNNDVSGLNFLIGLECLIETYENKLMAQVGTIFNSAYQHEYYNANALQQWTNISNYFIEDGNFGERIRTKLSNFISSIVDGDASDDEIDMVADIDTDTSSDYQDDHNEFMNPDVFTAFGKGQNDILADCEHNYFRETDGTKTVVNYNLFSQPDMFHGTTHSKLLYRDDNVVANEFKYTDTTYTMESNEATGFLEN